MAGERHMIRALCGLNKTFDKDVTIVLALNRISALIGIFFGNALPYVYFGCLSSIELREGGGVLQEFLGGDVPLGPGIVPLNFATLY